MTREEALARLRLHEGELRESGLSALYMLGSAARNDATETSDVDLIERHIHHYGGIDADCVWQAAKTGLVPLREACTVGLDSLNS